MVSRSSFLYDGIAPNIVYNGFPLPNRIPPNTTFEIDDMEDEWTFQNNSFDYIHMRTLAGSFSDWDAILAQAYKWVSRVGYA